MVKCVFPWFTPTGVGTTGALFFTQTRLAGSPPRAWGQHNHRRGRGGIRAVHPHGRGDNMTRLAARQASRGSPPRAWGQRPQSMARCHRCRFTPTGVGTTHSIAAARRLIKVHPHGRGDNNGSLVIEREQDGSPPRAWGQRASVGASLAPPRFTPTGVGTTQRPETNCSRKSVHPHGRGDNGHRRCDVAGVDGSPPRAWGQRSCPARPRLAQWFTPTGVGTTP